MCKVSVNPVDKVQLAINIWNEPVSITDPFFARWVNSLIAMDGYVLDLKLVEPNTLEDLKVVDNTVQGNRAAMKIVTDAFYYDIEQTNQLKQSRY